jgi:hypothetical protein
MKSPCALALVGAITLAPCAIPAGAQPFNRTWVSNAGTDGGSCGPIATPCASFQGALTNTASGGEINCLTPGDFGGNDGSLNIGQSVSIICDGVSKGSIFNSSGTGAVFVRGGPKAVVYLSGLDLQGTAGAAGADAITVGGASAVYVVHCTIRGFDGANGTGVYILSNDPTRVVIKDSVIVNNINGVVVAGQNGQTSAAIMVNTVIDGNAEAAAIGYNANSAIALQQTLLTGSPDGLELQSGASGVLIGPSNTIAGAITGTTTSVPFK